MKKGIGSKENMETAKKVYLEEEGRNIYRILERLDTEHGLKISAQTLYAWRAGGNWQAKADACLEHYIMRGLIRLIKKYERDMENSQRPDAQAAYAYINMVKTAVTLSGKYPHRADPAEMKRVAEEILEREYGIKRG
ncbi:MAG: hypothetical protein Q8J64_10430 [Thermodesulfovibrionales bacterium]|nr:hypothetical protein [Thermodesulfovibrionales bacterium]